MCLVRISSSWIAESVYEQFHNQIWRNHNFKNDTNTFSTENIDVGLS